ncbi:MAG: N-acetyl sugar amidotransferase [Bacteroidota bacterium]
MQSNHSYQICTRCILSTSDDPVIYFDEKGICNHCILYDKMVQERILPLKEREKKLIQIVSEIKQKGKGNKYDCVIGISGGVDSTYVAYLVKELGLRPLAVHCDNGWNSELAVSNISNILKKLDIDLYTHVINWDEFRQLQLAYLKASVIDVEATSDHAIFATLYEAANKYNVKYILSGESFATEGYLPERWIHNKNDLINIKAIFKKFGAGKLKTFPTLGFLKKIYFEKIKKIQYIRILDQIEYNKTEAKRIISEKLNWRDYGGKHYESIITRFYQSYILPKKFHVDKRRSHLSTLICSGQLTREEALNEIEKPSIEPAKLQEDKTYVLKKFGLSNDEFENIMALPEVPHRNYPSFLNFIDSIKPYYQPLKWLLNSNVKKSPPSINKKGKRIAMLLDNGFTNDKRVIQEATSIAENFDLTLFCMKGNQLPLREIFKNVKVIRTIPEDIFRLQSYYKLKQIAREIASYKFDVIHCHDYLMLNIGAMVKGLNPETILVYDSHELFHSWPLNFSSNNLIIILKSFFVRKIQVFNEKKFGRHIDYLVTVNQSLADNLQNYFKLENTPVVVRNVPQLEAKSSSENILRKKFDIPDNKKILVFIGAHIYLKTLNMAQVLNEVGNKDDLAFVIISSADEHRKQVEDYVHQKKFNNVYFHNVVPHNEITAYLSGCDAGIIPTWNKKDLSYWYALDNKLFNYLMAELPILSTAQPEYKAIVEKYNIGVCVNPDEHGAYYNGWKKLIENKGQYLNKLVETKKELNWENESQSLINFYDQLLDRKISTEPVVNELPRIAMLLDNSFTMDSRVYREAKTLVSLGYHLTIYAVKRNDLIQEELKEGILIRRIFGQEIFDLKNSSSRKEIAKILSRERFDILHCHDQLMLYIGSIIKKLRPEIKLIYDSHELFHSWPINYSSKANAWVKLKSDIVRKAEVRRELNSSKQIDRLITVSNSLGDDLKAYFHLKHEPVIVRNMAEYEEAHELKNNLRQKLGINEHVRIVLNFSLYIYWKSRNIEAAIEQFANKPGVALVFICGEGGNKKEIMQWVKDNNYENIYFLPAMKPEQIVDTLHGADYGLLSTWNKKYMSYWLGLENKLFHYVMAELPILASAQPEHREIIDSHHIGVCVDADEPNAYFDGFLELEKHRAEYKAQVKKAKNILNWENEQFKLLKLYTQLTSEINVLPKKNLTVVVTEKSPENIIDWNNLAIKSNNLWQSTYFDQTQIHIGNSSVYFQCFYNNQLVGGVKLFLFESRRLPSFLKFISRNISQKAELIFEEDFRENEEMYLSICDEVSTWCKQKKIHSMEVMGFYGDSRRRLVSAVSAKITSYREFDVAVIDLKLSEDQLWHKIYPKHRSEVNKAHRYNLEFKQVNDIEYFLSLLDETYRRQNLHTPDLTYIRKEFETLHSYKTAELFFVYEGDTILCGALIQLFGKKAVYAFGGSIKHSIGAGQLLQWEIIRHLKKSGYEYYQLGEVAKEVDERNLKFTVGISRFKKRFGTKQHPSFKTAYTFNSINRRIWKLLQFIFIRK